MKTIISHTIITLLALLACGCTHNDGDIGTLFGTWKVTELTVNNHPYDSSGNTIYFAFQNNVVGVHAVRADNIYVDNWFYGKFTHATINNAPHLILDFSGEKSFFPSYIPLDKEDNTMEMVSSSPNFMVWRMVRNSSTFLFTLKKWN